MSIYFYMSPPYKIGRHFWRYVVKSHPDYGRVTDYEFSNQQDGGYRTQSEWPTYDGDDGCYAGCPQGLRKIFDKHRNDIDAALNNTEPAQASLI